MKTTYLTILILLCATLGFAQTAQVDSVHPYFIGPLNGNAIRDSLDNFEPPIFTPVKSPFNPITISIFHSKSLYTLTPLNLHEELKELKPFKVSMPRRQSYGILNDNALLGAVPLFDSLPVVVTVYGINDRNKDLYRFRVVEDGTKELVSWQTPRFFSPVMMYYRHNADGTEMTQMAYLGAFSAPIGHGLTIEIKSLQQPDTLFRLSAVWIKRAPRILGTFGPEKLKQLIEVYKFQWKYDAYKPRAAYYYGDIDLSPVDSLLKRDTVLRSDENNLFFYLNDKIKKASLVEYNLVRGSDSSGWKANDFDPNIIWLERLSPGSYTLLLRYAFQRQTVSAFRFKIKTAWYQTAAAKAALGVLLLLFAALLYSFFKSRKQKRQLQQQSQQRQKAEIGLQSIRAQFNPHFVFNALSSIQGLVHKRDTANADKYLSDFSRLMRESLQSGSKEMIPLEKELAMLKSYIELEQLRFRFNFGIYTDKAINIHTTELPTLLLQPLIENAIKHGIAGMYEQGVLQVKMIAMQNSLQIEISDNGLGFDPDLATSGYGIQLTKERIQLLSELDPKAPVTLHFESTGHGTTAILLFKNWLV